MARRRTETDRDGVTFTPTGKVRISVWLTLAAVVLVATLLFVFVGTFGGSGSDAAPDQPQRRVASASANRVPLRSQQRVPASDTADRPRLPDNDSRRVADQDDPDVAAADELAADGHSAEGSDAPSGIELFPPPGTDPVRPGIVVPDDFELPPGFVRHYQTTDNGKQLPAILKFHPDYQPVDEHGDKIALPEDRIVPADMAPPGLPHTMLEVPDDAVPMIEGPNDRPDAD